MQNPVWTIFDQLNFLILRGGGKLEKSRTWECLAACFLERGAFGSSAANQACEQSAPQWKQTTDITSQANNLIAFRSLWEEEEEANHNTADTAHSNASGNLSPPPRAMMFDSLIDRKNRLRSVFCRNLGRTKTIVEQNLLGFRIFSFTLGTPNWTKFILN